MNLDVVNDVFNNLKENNFVQNFIKDLSKYLESKLNYENQEIPIIEDILSKNNLTTGNKNSIRGSLNNIILSYAKNDVIYFIKDNKTYWSNNKKCYNNDIYVILKAENENIEELEVNKKDMPKDVKVNDVLRFENNNYVIDNISTKELKEEIINNAKKILEKQNINLEDYRKDGHLYLVTEELGNNRFLKDLTDKSKTEFEETSISKDLLSKAVEGTVLKFINGKYEYYSDNGFEMIDK